MKNVTYIIFGILILFFIIIIGNHFFGILREGMGEGTSAPPECPPGGWKDISPRALEKVPGGREFQCGDAPNEKKYKSTKTVCPNNLVHNKATGLCDEQSLLSAAGSDGVCNAERDWVKYKFTKDDFISIVSQPGIKQLPGSDANDLYNDLEILRNYNNLAKYPNDLEKIYRPKNAFEGRSTKTWWFLGKSQGTGGVDIEKKLQDYAKQKYVCPVVASATPVVASATPVVASATPVVASAAPVVASATPVVASATPVVASDGGNEDSGDAEDESSYAEGERQRATGGRVYFSSKIIKV
jgi:hypothetical protein